MSKPDKLSPCMPVSCEVAEVYAIKALAAGTANADQQKRALDWIIKQAAHAYDLSYRFDSDRETAFAEGSRWVGLQIVKWINIDPERVPLKGN